MRLGIQKKSIAAISILMMVLAFSLMAISLYEGSSAIRSEMMTHGDITAKNLAYNATYSALIGDTSTITEFLNGIMAEKEVMYARIVQTNGTVLAERRRDDVVLSHYGAATGELSAGEDADPQPATYDDGKGMMHFQIPIVVRHDQQEDLGPEMRLYDIGRDSTKSVPASSRVIGYAQIGMTTRFVEATISHIRTDMIWITIVAVLIAMLVTSVLVRWTLHPINELVVATGRVAGGGYDYKVDAGGNDEIGDLAASFNKMTSDLKASRDALVEKDLLEALVLELKEAQQQLVQAGKMAAVGQLAAGVAHEINNPLAGIMGYAQLAGEQMRSKHASGIAPAELPKFIAYIDNMEKQSQRCKQIVQNLLRFARTSTTDEIERVNCNDVLRETLSFLSHQMTASAIEVETRLDAELPAISGQAGKLQQILTNILINAVQAIKNDGRITVATEAHAGWIDIMISDTGEGIPAANLDKIFEPFFTTKDIGQGTGLGLSVTYGLVKEMNGKIGVESTVGVGTTFTVSFPIPDEKIPTETEGDPDRFPAVSLTTREGFPRV